MSLPNKETTACPIISELSKHLRVNSKSGISACLTQLRNDPLRCRDFADQGGLQILVKLLRSQNNAILNMSLSILANACVSTDARYKVRDSKIQDNVVLIMKSPKPDASVLCRACRLVGNLSECSWHAQSLCNAGVIKPLVVILQLKTNRQTYLMAVRAVRNIWSIWNGSRDKFLDAEAIRFITQLFVMAREQCNIDSKYNELMEVCLKTMCAFLVSPDVRCGEQMEVDKDKQGYKCLLRCCSEGNKMAIRCLYSLCQITRFRLVLGSSGTIEQLIYVIKSGDPNLLKDILASLCLFCRDSVNRAKINNGGGLELIVMLLKKPDLERYHPMLLHALTHFMFCNDSMAILEKHGLIEVLIEQLKKTAVETIAEKSNLSVNTNSNALKRCRDGMPYRKISRISAGRFCKLHFEGDSSPGSATSICSSPPSTPPLLHDDSMMESYDVGDDDYSPVYSDTEWADNDDAELQDGEADSLRSCKSLTIDTENSCDSEKAKRTFLFFHCDYTALILLYALSFLPKPIKRLADPATIKPLSAYIRRTKNEKAVEILNRIVRNGAYFMNLLKQGFVFEAQSLYKADLYMQQLSFVAETGGAVGQLSSVLLRGEEQLKLIVAVSIPFLIRKSRTLKSLLQNHGGLQLIFRLLNEPSHELHEQAIWSICRLAATLQIRPKTVEKCSATTMNNSLLHEYLLSTCCENDQPQPSSIVTFELDDGTTIEACRRTLCQRSDVFFAMLEGSFCESGKRRVRLKNASRGGLDTLILAATGVSYKHRSIESLLDAVLLADMFLMPDLSDTLTDSSVAKLSHDNFSRAWYWAKAKACRELQVCCVKSFLTADMTRNQMVRAFHDFSATDAFDEFLCDIREIIVDVLCQLDQYST